MSAPVVFSLTEPQVRALKLLLLDPGEVDLRWARTLARLAERGLVSGDGARAWSLTRPGRIAAELVNALPATNGHGG